MGIREHLHFKDVAKIYLKTWQFILLRFIMILVFIGIAIFYFSSAFGVVLGRIGISSITNILLSLGSMTTATYLYWHIYKLFSKYIFYLVKAAHIAVIVDYIQEKPPKPHLQLAHGFKKVKEKFVSVSLLFPLHAVLESMLKEVHNRLMATSKQLSLPKPLAYILSGTVNTAVNYVDECIVAYIFAHKGEDAWQSAKDGTVLYVQNWLWIILTAGILSTVVYGAMALTGTYIYFEGIPFSSLDLILRSIYSVMTVGIVIILYAGIAQPFMEISIIVTYLEEIRGQKPDSKTFEWLKQNSKKFGQLMVAGVGGAVGGGLFKKLTH